MSTSITFVLFAFLALANYRLSRSVLYPPFIFCVMWLVDLGVYSLHLVEMDTIEVFTYVVVSAGALAFSLGGLAAFFVPNSIVNVRFSLVGRARPLDHQYRSKLVKYSLVAALGIGTIVSVVHTFRAASLGVGETFFASARSELIAEVNSDERQFSVLTYIVPWSIFAAVLFGLERRDRAFWTMTGIAFVGCLFSTGRTTFLMLITALIATYMLKANRVRFLPAARILSWPVLVFFVLFEGLTFVSKDTSGTGLNAGGVVLLYGVNYIVGPLAAFNLFLMHRQDYALTSNHTFKFPLEVASALHLTNYVPPTNEFVFVPFPHNVFTVYRYFVGDFGVIGMLGVMLFIGLFHALLYRKACTGDAFSTYLLSLSLYSAIMVIFDDQYSMLGFYLNIVLFGAIYHFLRSQAMLRIPGPLPRISRIVQS